VICSLGEDAPTSSIAPGNGSFRFSNGLRVAPLFATLLLAVPLFSVAVGPAFASTLTLNDDFVSAAPVGNPAASTYVTDETSTVTTYNSNGSVDWIADVRSWVYTNSTTNPYSTADTVDNPIPVADRVDSAMTFVYQINVTSLTGDVGQLDVANFGTNQTDVGYFDTQNPTEAPEIFPSFLDRDTAGLNSTISFLFFTSDQPSQFQVIDPGQYSALLVVNTDATTYHSSNVELQDGANGTGASYAVYGPTIIETPEPTSVVLIVLGLGGLLAVARARRSERE
jgi:hypothetical protein